jgi:hypothetical protein
MRHFSKIGFLLSAFLFSAAAVSAGNYRFEPGDTVLTNCHEIYTKGVVNAQVDDGYTIHFPKKSGPINCPPFRWHAEFVLPFESVPEYHLQYFGGIKKDKVFRVGETVTLRFDADKRIVQDKNTVDIQAQITDISSNGAVALKLISSDPESAAMFWKWVGSNYVDLRHDALAMEREKRQ